jgi:hypothetical protein
VGFVGEAVLELCRAAIAERGMEPATVVEHLDGLEQRLPRLLSCGVGLVVDQLPLGGAEEALGHGVVEAIA